MPKTCTPAGSSASCVADHVDTAEELWFIFTSNFRMGQEKLKEKRLTVALLLLPDGLALSISETADLLGLSHMAIWRVYTELCEKKKNQTNPDVQGAGNPWVETSC